MSREIFEDGAYSNYEYILNDFINLAVNRFNWTNLPNGLTSEQLELMLIEHGQVMCFKDKNMGTFILPCFGETELNVYGLPTSYRVMGLNGKYNESIDIDDGVLIKNNPLGSADLPLIQTYAKRIDDLEMTQEVNLFQQAMPKIIIGDENSKMTAKNFVDKIRKYKFVIFGKKSLGSLIQNSDVLDTSSPFILDKLQAYKNEVRSELLTKLGINNNNIVKKERLIVDEVNANNDLIAIMLDLMFDLRKKACEEINQILGENIQVEKREVELNGYDNINLGGTDRE